MGIKEDAPPRIEPGRYYSGHEMVLLATEIEKIGHVIYRQAEKLAVSKEAGEIFKMLACDELEHIKILHNEIKPLFRKHETHWESDETVANYLLNVADPDIFPDRDTLKKRVRSIKNEKEAIDLSLEGEIKSIAFYENMLGCIEKECNEGMKAVRKIIEEERKHKEKLEKLKNKLGY